MTHQPQTKRGYAVPLGIVCLLIGILFNKYILENTIIGDAQISKGLSKPLILIQLILIAVGLFLIIKRPYIYPRIRPSFPLFIALAGMVISLLLMPPIFSATLAMTNLVAGEPPALWVFSIILFLFSGFIIFYRGKGDDQIASLFLGLLMLISIELIARLFVVCFLPGIKPELAISANRTYPEFLSHVGHPFLQHTANPAYVHLGAKMHEDAKPFNRFGFIGPEYSYEKPEGVIRIACLGESTTAKGFPKEMEDYLNQWNDDSQYRFEALNFGVGGYTTANSLVNFVLNVVDFDPDYVVIHHAWNEYYVRNTDEEFRSDYAHIFIYFHEPVIPDR